MCAPDCHLSTPFALPPCVPLKVRNRVLCLWRADVSRRLEEKEAVAAAANPADASYALAAHRFLSALGCVFTHSHGVRDDAAQRAQLPFEAKKRTRR